MSLGELALVAIGRNEGERLRRCLASVQGRVGCLVYVDSGSTDGSVEAARVLGADVVELDMRQPFTAARARNAGVARVREKLPGVRFIQMVDGDCEVAAGWLDTARAALDAEPTLAAVLGRRRERFPQASIYNRLCDIEWTIPPGLVKACGGDVMFRAEALAQVGGYRDDLIAGEEPELCIRLRQRGWQIRCVAAEMTLHDAAMTRFGQWWRRSTRAGYAYAEGARLHGAPPERHWVKPLKSALAWSLGPPLAAMVGVAAFGWMGLLPLLAYPLQVARLALRGGEARGARALFLVLGKFPEAQGALRYARLALLKRRGGLIEYK
ncbi:MAG TPA: glycosyltransferase [Methylibium sp.]|uniref:glycosyltransferase family 2 protein n=1 Tax=Methylibium sp. TaxID=2067992 RepID=UPI002DBA4E98|nr:glycosyltransferase [Methylibium sp.]HEU4459257.1 glycosyltransferase [Methylibium sp.]